MGSSFKQGLKEEHCGMAVITIEPKEEAILVELLRCQKCCSLV